MHIERHKLHPIGIFFKKKEGEKEDFAYFGTLPFGPRALHSCLYSLDVYIIKIVVFICFCFCFLQSYLLNI